MFLCLEHLISLDTTVAIKTLVSGALYAQAQSVLDTGKISETQAIALLDLLDYQRSGLAQLAESPLHQQAFLALFDFAFTLPSIRPSDQWPALYSRVQSWWKTGLQHLSITGRTTVVTVALSRLREMTNEVDCNIR